MKKIAIMLILVIVCAVGLVMLNRTEGLNAAEPENAGLSAQLDDVLNNQKVILQKLDDMAEQIQIVKIRATR